MLLFFMEIQEEKGQLIPEDYLMNFLAEIDEISKTKIFKKYDKTDERPKFTKK